MSSKIHESLVASIEARQTHRLRHQVLRPNQDIEDMVYPNDSLDESFHFGAIVADRVVGVISVYPENESGILNQGRWRIRGMAVEPGLQGQKLGQRLVETALAELKGRRAESVWCNARTSALGFYQKLGFNTVGEEFMIEGIGPHYIAELKFGKAWT